jgi:UDP-N-acetylmuramoyl-tripeptide--D-alanyl-D-alanine ligase
MTTPIFILLEKYLTCTGVSTDTRTIQEGEMYVALKGGNFNGNQFAEKALSMGAKFALIDEPEFFTDKERMFLVKDGLQALQHLARAYRNTFDIPIIGITGSNGKTTTKELVFAVLNTHFKAYATFGNLNNHIGVPLTLLRMPRNTEIAVIEMGANHQGEIAELSNIADPTFGLITNIGKAHLEGFGGVEGVKKGKSELYQYLSKYGGVALVNTDSEFLDDLSSIVEKRITYSLINQQSDFPFSIHENVNDFVAVAFQKTVFRSGLVGDYNRNNIMSAVTTGLVFDIPNTKIKEAIAGYLPTNNRSQLMEHKGAKVLMDAYNANPTSMSHALKNFAEMDFCEKKIAILGEMLELGNQSEVEHQQMALLCESLPIQQFVFTGKSFEKIQLPAGALYFPNMAELKNWFDTQHLENTFVFIKGSRGNKLELLLSK